ncbi:hypothetical protein LXL04_027932 [Taraxacum kok-saghyz]
MVSFVDYQTTYFSLGVAKQARHENPTRNRHETASIEIDQRLPSICSILHRSTSPVLLLLRLTFTASRPHESRPHVLTRSLILRFQPHLRFQRSNLHRPRPGVSNSNPSSPSSSSALHSFTALVLHRFTKRLISRKDQFHATQTPVLLHPISDFTQGPVQLRLLSSSPVSISIIKVSISIITVSISSSANMSNVEAINLSGDEGADEISKPTVAVASASLQAEVEELCKKVVKMNYLFRFIYECEPYRCICEFELYRSHLNLKLFANFDVRYSIVYSSRVISYSFKRSNQTIYNNHRIMSKSDSHNIAFNLASSIGSNSRAPTLFPEEYDA